MLAPGKIQHILCTGNLCSKEAENYLRQICSDLNSVKVCMWLCHEVLRQARSTKLRPLLTMFLFMLHHFPPQGDFDDPLVSKDTPEYVVVKLGNFRIGVVHGHQVCFVYTSHEVPSLLDIASYICTSLVQRISDRDATCAKLTTKSCLWQVASPLACSIVLTPCGPSRANAS